MRENYSLDRQRRGRQGEGERKSAPSIPTSLAPSSFLPQQNLFRNNRQDAPNLLPGISIFNRGVDHPVLLQHIY